MLRDFLGNLKRLLRGERAPGMPPPHPMSCFICGEPGLHPILRSPDGVARERTSWLCDRDFPPFLRKDGTRQERIDATAAKHLAMALDWTFPAGDPR